MKKILFVISLFAMMFLFGCSASMETYLTTTMVMNPSSVINYQFDDLEFSDLNEVDLLYYITDEAEDFKLMLDIIISIGYIPSLLDADNGIIDTLGELAEATVVSIADMLNYSATELNELAQDNGIVLTVDDIVGFMDLLTIKEGFPRAIGKSRIDYLELRLDTKLTSDQETGFNNLQDAYLILYALYDYDFFSKTFLEITDDLDAIQTTYSQDELDNMEIVFDLMVEIVE